MKTIEALFQKLTEITVPPLLEERILKRLLFENTKALQRMLFLSTLSVVASAGVFLYAVIAFGKALLNSEFWTLLSLAFSDMASIWSYSNEYAFSLLETFPVMSLIAILLPVFTLLVSLGWFLKLKEYNKNFYQLA